MLTDDALHAWWERMPEDTRRLLAEHVEGPIRPDVALRLWQDSGFLPVVRPGRSSEDMQRLAWRMSPEVSAFVRARSCDEAAHAGRVA